uniref:Uncharacterized protein n=1 Tax=Malurus cyaneus samueli TaxID=2593467 RepID=A0A8C5TLG9_9PASS
MGMSGGSSELTTVRVQDPRVQNEGSWNSYVDYKIFLHVRWMGWDGMGWDPWDGMGSGSTEGDPEPGGV